MSVEINLERLYILHRTEFRLTVFRREVVVVVRNVSEQLYLPTLIGCVCKVGLIVDERRAVFSFVSIEPKRCFVVLYLKPLLHETFLFETPMNALAPSILAEAVASNFLGLRYLMFNAEDILSPYLAS